MGEVFNETHAILVYESQRLDEKKRLFGSFYRKRKLKDIGELLKFLSYNREHRRFIRNASHDLLECLDDQKRKIENLPKTGNWEGLDQEFRTEERILKRLLKDYRNRSDAKQKQPKVNRNYQPQSLSSRFGSNVPLWKKILLWTTIALSVFLVFFFVTPFFARF